MVAGQVLPQRERQDHADQEQEQREDQVVEPEAFPLDVLELLAEAQGLRRAPPFAQRPRDLVAADDPEHVEAPQGVDRGQALGRRRVGLFGEIVGNGGHGSSCF